MLSHNERLKVALSALQSGKMVVLTDHPDRENEGDLIAPAEIISVNQMNFMIRHGSGIVCLATTPTLAEKLDLPLMVNATSNSSTRGTPFTVSIDAKFGISTGVSASDRVTTIKAVINDSACKADLVKPGHLFPLIADPHGVLVRNGHTEGSIDLVTLAGFKPAAVLCEIMHPDGEMMRGADLQTFAEQHALPILSIDDIIHHRLATENRIVEQASTSIHLQHHGSFQCMAFRESITNKEHMLLSKQIDPGSIPLVRIHSACTTGDIFGSSRCDCHDQLHFSLDRIQDEGGYLIYLSQEGRGIGLLNKLKAYHLQNDGYDTVEANQILNLPIDNRRYDIAANILRNLNIDEIRLLTNNPAKVDDLVSYGIRKVHRIEMPIFSHQHNSRYLQTKSIKMNHYIDLKACGGTE